jgi:UDP-N-acetylenolpyruvoylglucosamine reductase
MPEPLSIAKNCRHYAMCKIDFLGSGVCSSGLEKNFVSFYPQGRMILYEGLAEKKIPVTEKAVEIAATCNLCGKCDFQCYFITELRPTRVMKALKEFISEYLKEGGEAIAAPDDEILSEIKAIVGEEWASNDPAILYSYCHDLSPVSPPKMPDYIVLPGSKEEIAELVKIFNRHTIQYTVRGNGTNLLGFAVNTGVILDLNRMKTIEFDEKNWYVKTGAGVTAFELQKEAKKRGFRINAGEPAAMICSNIMGSGVMSAFSTTYGINADNFIDAEFVANDGSFFKLNDISSPNLFSYQDLSHQASPGICTSANIRLHPFTDDESGILVPFPSLDKALDFAGNCAVRHIGIAIAIMGTEYIANFFAPTKKLAAEVKEIFEKKLEISFLVLLIGDKYALAAVKDMDVPFINQKLLTALYLGLPDLKLASWLNLTRELSLEEPYEYLKLDSFVELAETALEPSAELLAREVDPDLRHFYEKLYSRSELTDMVWLTMFRILSTRIGRRKGFLPILIYLPIDFELIQEITVQYISIAEEQQIDHEFGFITPIDHGKRCIYEYDYFFDYNNTAELERLQIAAAQVNRLIDEYTKQKGTVRGHPYVLYQGFSRKENLLYT